MLYIPARSVPSRSNLRAAVGLTVVPDVGLVPYPSRACAHIRITRHSEASVRGRLSASGLRRAGVGQPFAPRPSGRPIPRALGIWPTAWTSRRRSNLRPPIRRQRASIPLRRSPLSARTLPPQRTAGRAADRLSGCGRPLEAISRHRREHKLWLWLTGFRAAGSDVSSREH